MAGDSVNKQYQQVKQFHVACGIEMPNTPTLLDSDFETKVHFSSELEYWCERMKKFSQHEGGSEVLDRSSYMLEELTEFMRASTIEDQADALIDLIYFAIGTFTLMGVNPEPIFDIVAEANLGKILPDGTVGRDPQGKITKPEGWKEEFAPEGKIREELEIQRIYNDYKNHTKGSK